MTERWKISVWVGDDLGVGDDNNVDGGVCAVAWPDSLVTDDWGRAAVGDPLLLLHLFHLVCILYCVVCLFWSRLFYLYKMLSKKLEAWGWPIYICSKILSRTSSHGSWDGKMKVDQKLWYYWGQRREKIWLVSDHRDTPMSWYRSNTVFAGWEGEGGEEGGVCNEERGWCWLWWCWWCCWWGWRAK